jgi:hypothetical protein
MQSVGEPEGKAGWHGWYECASTSVVALTWSQETEHELGGGSKCC